MARDPLAALLRLRSLEVAAARRDLAERLAGLSAAEQRAAAAAAAIQAEANSEATREAPHLYSAWLPRGRAAEERAAGDARLAAQASEIARQNLAETRAGERAVEWLREQRLIEERQRAARREQAALDEAAARRAVSLSPRRP